MLSKAKVFLLLGSPASGKTTIAKKFADTLQCLKYQNIYCIETDHLVEMEVNYCFPEHEDKSFWFTTLMYIIDHIFDTADIIIIEGVFTDDKCILAIQKVDPNVIILNIKCSLEVCLERNKNRSKQLDEYEVKRLWSTHRDDSWIQISSDRNIEEIISDLIVFL